MDLRPTKLDYYDHVWKLESKSTFISYIKSDDCKRALILDFSIFHPQGGGQPADTGFICFVDSSLRFCVQDVQLKDGVVFHYGVVEDGSREDELEQEKGKEVSLCGNEARRKLNSRCL